MTVSSMEVTSSNPSIKNGSLSSQDSETSKESYRKIGDIGDKEVNGSTIIPEDGEGKIDIIEGNEEGNRKRKNCCHYIKSAQFQVYASHFLSSWGDRMWMFAGGLFLLEVTPGSLRLSAIYGAAISVTVILFGAGVGRWVDSSSRLQTAQISLSIQNLMVCVCAGLLVWITTQREFFTAWDGWALVLAEAGVILTACLAQIGTLGCKLAIEKDWIIVICGQDKTTLAKMNSVLRTVDLSTEVLAPVIVGAVMTGFGLAAGGIVIAAWNVGSLLFEYGLLHHLYYSSPDLQKPKNINENSTALEGREGETDDANSSKESKERHVFIQRLISAWTAWKAYMSHPVRDAGIGLALLFMTVLAFDNYSRAFVYESGVSETILGVLTAIASMSGIMGSLVFPILRKKLGVTTTGIVGFGAETLCLTFCVASVFAPGSPFEPSALIPGHRSSEGNSSLASAHQYVPYNMIMANGLAEGDSTAVPNVTASVSPEPETPEDVIYTSVILLLTGIITSRFGLWIADLTVTQILQENVEDSQRGAINGVQSSLNQSLDLLRSILLIILPTRETYGFLIILSFVFVFVAWMMFIFYARKHPSPTTSPATSPEVELGSEAI